MEILTQMTPKIGSKWLRMGWQICLRPLVFRSPLVWAENHPQLEVEQNTGKSESVPISLFPNPDWHIFETSLRGKSHVLSNLPCQDAHFSESTKDYTLAIVSDGIGSASHSDLGSKFVVARAEEIFIEVLKANGWLKGTLPSDDIWELTVQHCLIRIRKDLEAYAEEIGLSIRDLACTLILLVICPNGLLVANVGDGRAGYTQEEDLSQWKACMTPFRGSQPGETMSLASPFFKKRTYIGHKVIRNPITGFILMSDGVENGLWFCQDFDPQEKVLTLPNKPFSQLIQALAQALKNDLKNGLAKAQADQNFQTFVEEGTPALQHETDDKTLILGVKK